MVEAELQIPAVDEAALRAEIARLNKVAKALMDRAERSTKVEGSDFSMFQTAIMLEDQVRRRTTELEAALTENERINHALRESEARFRGLVSQSLVGIAMIEDGKLTYANPKLALMFGYSEQEIIQLGLLDLAAPAARPVVAEQMRRRLSGEVDRVEYAFQGQRKDGTTLDIEAHSSVMDLAGKRALISLLLDITERTQAAREVQKLQEQLREQAIHDSLTGLYNRQRLGEFFERELQLAKRRRHSVSVVMADLDHFKVVNDQYGHRCGDEVLKIFSDLIRRTYRASDFSCRYGGEEFLILLPDVTHKSACERTEHLRSAIENTPVDFDGSTVRVTASFGVATYPRDGETADELIAAADHALYAAKRGGRNQIQSASPCCGTDLAGASAPGAHRPEHPRHRAS